MDDCSPFCIALKPSHLAPLCKFKEGGLPPTFIALPLEIQHHASLACKVETALQLPHLNSASCPCTNTYNDTLSASQEENVEEQHSSGLIPLDLSPFVPNPFAFIIPALLFLDESFHISSWALFGIS